MTIPASAIVQVNPGVIGAGGSALDLNGLVLTNSPLVPIGTVPGFASANDVGNFFGQGSAEANIAGVYFLGPDNSTKKPGNLLFAQYPAASVAGYMRGGALTGMTLTQLQALSGILTVSVDGSAKTSSSISLSSATSFSNAATIIQAAFSSLGGTVTYSSQLNAFQFTSSTAGASSSVSFATGSLSAGLLLTQATAAVISAGAVAGVPATNLTAITQVTQNWASFMTTFEPAEPTDKLAFSAWVNSQNNRYAYAGWDTDVNAAVANNMTCWGALLVAGDFSGSIPVSQSMLDAAFVLSFIASLDFTRTNGRATLAFKSQTGLTATVTDQTIAATLLANGYNFYGAYATANDQFIFLYDGQVSGPFEWVDSYVNQIWLNNGLQLAVMTLITTVNSIPYNAPGYALIEASCMDPINAGLNFGAIRAGVTLSALQAAEVNNQAGVDISSTLQTRGWYLQVLDATPQVRQARTSPPITLWYMDGGSVQQITLASIELQ